MEAQVYWARHHDVAAELWSRTTNKSEPPRRVRRWCAPSFVESVWWILMPRWLVFGFQILSV
jgi:hypothetical protein